MKKITFSFQWRNFSKKAFFGWLRHYKLFFFLAFLGVASWSGYEWRKNLFDYSWNAEERQRYLEATIKETAFQEDDFLRAVEKLEGMERKHAEQFMPSQELFMGEMGEEGRKR